MPQLCLRHPDNWCLRPKYPSAAPTSPCDLNTMHVDRMVRLLRCCFMTGRHNEELLLLRHYRMAAQIADAPTLQSLFFPYLKRLLQMMNEYGHPRTIKGYHFQFQEVLSHFIVRYIGMEPLGSSADFTCPTLGCAAATAPLGCRDCHELDAFMVHPHMRTVEIPSDSDTTAHLMAQLKGQQHLLLLVRRCRADPTTIILTISKKKKRTAPPDPYHEQWCRRVDKTDELCLTVCSKEEWRYLLGARFEELLHLKAVKME